MSAPAPLYLDTSAVLRAILESGTTPDIEEKIASAPILLTSRLSQVEAARVLLRIRALRTVSEAKLADATRDINRLWRRCDIWELSHSVCRLATEVAPSQRLRTLDALHLATYILARERIAGLELLTADERLRDAAGQ
ncbi:MAG TPA: type II toxin-antitoxin system VapC family toxin [Gemmatimonadales bacterium]|jgi:predicted nucleic acid-binding protein|nr:type II toxin-antitoxin system VapC family toxin [Gemmatimonadales bacterium]